VFLFLCEKVKEWCLKTPLFVWFFVWFLSFLFEELRNPFTCELHWNYFEEVYLVTALVPSETACLANSPGRSNLTAVWISREVIVDLLL